MVVLYREYIITRVFNLEYSHRNTVYKVMKVYVRKRYMSVLLDSTRASSTLNGVLGILRVARRGDNSMQALQNRNSKLGHSAIMKAHINALNHIYENHSLAHVHV